MLIIKMILILGLLIIFCLNVSFFNVNAYANLSYSKCVSFSYEPRLPKDPVVTI